MKNQFTALWPLLAIFVIGGLTLFLFTRPKQDKRLRSELKAKNPGGGATYSENDYIAFADRIYQALDGLNIFNSGKSTLSAVFSQMRTKADLYNLEAAFGIRDGESLGAWIKNDGLSDFTRQTLSDLGFDYNFSIVE